MVIYIFHSKQKETETNQSSDNYLYYRNYQLIHTTYNFKFYTLFLMSNKLAIH